jgi:pilus assembly protein CpaD
MSSINRLALPVALAAFALIAACASKPPVKGARLDGPTPLDQYQLKTHDAPDQVGLTIHSEGLSPAQREALAAFAVRWRTAGEGAITLQTPSDAPDPEAARIFTLAAETTLASLGVPYDHVRAVTYAQGGAPKALVQVSFEAVVADAPDCKTVKWESLSSTKDNKPYKKFGCTFAANLAAQIADPRDLRGDTPLSPADNMRRMHILSNYRTGKATSSEKDTQASGAVSTAVGQQ